MESFNVRVSLFRPDELQALFARDREELIDSPAGLRYLGMMAQATEIARAGLPGESDPLAEIVAR